MPGNVPGLGSHSPQLAFSMSPGSLIRGITYLINAIRVESFHIVCYLYARGAGIYKLVLLFL